MTAPDVNQGARWKSYTKWNIELSELFTVRMLATFHL